MHLVSLSLSLKCFRSGLNAKWMMTTFTPWWPTRGQARAWNRHRGLTVLGFCRAACWRTVAAAAAVAEPRTRSGQKSSWRRDGWSLPDVYACHGRCRRAGVAPPCSNSDPIWIQTGRRRRWWRRPVPRWSASPVGGASPVGVWCTDCHPAASLCATPFQRPALVAAAGDRRCCGGCDRRPVSSPVRWSLRWACRRSGTDPTASAAGPSCPPIYRDRHRRTSLLVWSLRPLRSSTCGTVDYAC